VSKSKLPVFFFIFMMLQSVDAAARYAAIVIDADTGHVIHENEAAQRWYPASLTKVMTIYMTLSAIESGKLRLDDILTVSSHAARQPNSRLGLRTGQTISVEQAIMAVTTRSANDAAVLLAETVGGSEANFASMMTHQAHQLGMTSSSFQNASGLPDEGQISSARDLAILSATLIRNFPQHYHYFSATEFHYKGRVLPNTNRILKTYPDADGMKTGFTCGSGYNLIASAKRNGHRLIGVLLGAHSSGERFEQMGNLLDVGFEKVNFQENHIPISQLKADNASPPPFQLASNRCAGSAVQMGADAGSASHEPIRILPQAKHPRLIQKAVLEQPVAHPGQCHKKHHHCHATVATPVKVAVKKPARARLPKAMKKLEKHHAVKKQPVEKKHSGQRSN
jgi:D-alanyl-D-alanine carboxypeptidase